MQRPHVTYPGSTSLVVMMTIVAVTLVAQSSSTPVAAPAPAGPSFFGGGGSSQLSLLGSLGARSASSSSGGGGGGGSSSSGSDPCFDDDGAPVRCQPDFVNAAFGRQVVASSTCGSPSVTRYCQTSRDRDGRVGRSCYVCDASQPKRRHPASYLTDLNNPSNLTCWISQPITERPVLSNSSNVTLTLSLGKKFEVSGLPFGGSVTVVWGRRFKMRGQCAYR